MKNLIAFTLASLTLLGSVACHSENVAGQSGEAERLSPEEAFQKAWQYAERGHDNLYTFSLTEEEAYKLGISGESYAQALAWLKTINIYQKVWKHTDFVNEQYILLLTEEKACELGISGEEYVQIMETMAKMNANIRKIVKARELNAKPASSTVKALISLANSHETLIKPPYVLKTREDMLRYMRAND
jgi:hypothetical protein